MRYCRCTIEVGKIVVYISCTEVYCGKNYYNRIVRWVSLKLLMTKTGDILSLNIEKETSERQIDIYSPGKHEKGIISIPKLLSSGTRNE